MVQGGMTFIKYLTFFFNFLFLIFGLIFIIIGSLAMSGLGDVMKLASKIQAPIILIIILGIFIFVLSFFGCCGAIKENYCMLMTFSVIIFLIFIIEIAAGVAAYVYRNQLTNKIKEGAEKEMKKYNSSSAETDFWDNIQKKFNCCGVDGPEDWNTALNITKLPSSCCRDDSDNCTMNDPTIRHKGCADAIIEVFQKYSTQIIIAALVIAFLQLLGIIFGCCLARSIKKEYETV